jgi:hypothetical protein
MQHYVASDTTKRLGVLAAESNICPVVSQSDEEKEAERTEAILKR